MAELPLDTALATGLESILVAAVLLAVGYLVVDALLGDRAGVPIRLGLAFPGLMAYVLILALIHIGSGGLVFGSPSAIRAGTAALGSALIVRKIFIARRRSKRRSADEPQSHQRFGRRDALLVAGLVALAVALWGSPIVRMIPLGHSGDQTVHMGWAAELMNGETTPSGPLSGAIPNYYPWLFHALVAFIASLTAGGRAFHAQGPLLVVQVTGAVLALYALGRELGGRVTTGAFAAVFGALSGGIGFLLLSRPDFVFDPRENGGEEALRYAGDLLSRRSYNVSFHNLAPTFPRDVAFALTVAFLVMLVRGFRRKSSADFLGAGAVLGMIGLTGGETFIVGVGITIAASVVSIDVGRIRTALATLIPALAVWGLWLVPVAVNYVRLGGFVNTAAEPVTLTPLAVLGAWGIVTPLALIGLGPWMEHRHEAAMRILPLVVIVPLVGVLLASSLPGLLGAGFTTLGRQHRYWPLVHLGVVLFAALGASYVFDRVARNSRGWARIVVAAAVALAVPSPLLASVALPAKVPPDPTLTASLLGDERSPLNLLAPSVGERCVVAGPEDGGLLAFAYTGYRFLSLNFPLSAPARPRWGDIYERIPPPSERVAANEVLVAEGTTADELRAIIDKYGVDRVIVSSQRAESVFAGYTHQKTNATSAPSAAVVRTGHCID